MNKELYDKVVKLISEEMNLDEKKIQPKSNFVDDLGCDSLDTVELVMKMEEEFDIVISDSDAEQIKTVEGLVDFIEGKKK